VLNALRLMGKAGFTLADIYAQEAALARLHPQNLHVRDVIPAEAGIHGLFPLPLVLWIGTTTLDPRLRGDDA